ncbi:hypothetical protein Noda2021_04050 [Candidatus Dependentiae bacterium Noda2021]|nr:hypothetical protein Noda2021_04050 [Candidatus Dependentiae bacterium Noda2021]
MTPVFSETNYAKKIDILAQEITRLKNYLYAIQEIINQSNQSFEAYKKYNEFFYLTYISYYNELIYGISRLQDKSSDSLSIMKMLEESLQYHTDEQSCHEKQILSQIKEIIVGYKIRTQRNRLGRAHFDREVATNTDEQKKVYERSKTELNEITEYIQLLTRALEILSARLSNPIVLLDPLPSLKKEIKILFQELSAPKNITN